MRLCTAVAILCLACLGPASSVFSEDFTLHVEYRHELRMLGVPAVQRGVWTLRLHPPTACRLDLLDSSFPVIYRYEDDGLIRYELDTQNRTYTRQSVVLARKKLRDKLDDAGISHDVDPAFLTAGMGQKTGWTEQHRKDGLVYLHYTLQRRLVAAAIVVEDSQSPSAALMFAFFQELPFIKHHWMLQAVRDLVSMGRITYFEYSPQGPEYYVFHVTHSEPEAIPFSEELFLPPPEYVEKQPADEVEVHPPAAPVTPPDDASSPTAPADGPPSSGEEPLPAPSG